MARKFGNLATDRIAISPHAAINDIPKNNGVMTCVVTGMRSLQEARANLTHMRTPIPATLWRELESERLIG